MTHYTRTLTVPTFMHLDRLPEDSGANANDAPQPAARATVPATAGRTRWALARRWMYVVIIFLTGAATANPTASDIEHSLGEIGTSWSRGYHSGQIAGAGIGALFVSFALGALLMGWRKSTRPLIPGTACVIAILSFLGDAGREAAETEAQMSALQQWAENPGVAGGPESAPPPRTREARIAWATRKALRDITDHVRVLAESQGINPQTAPAAWLSAAYLADARKHPEIPEYFTRYQRFLRERDSTYLSLLAERTEARLRGAGLPRWEIEKIMVGIHADLEQSTPDLRRRTADQLAVAAAALEMHEYLERVDPRVDLDAATGTVRFANEAERTRAFYLLDQVQRLSARDAAQRE